MKRIVIALTVALAACEGEPPKTPAGAPNVAAPEATAEAPAPSAQPSAAPSAPAAAASPSPASPCPCIGGGDGGTTTASADGEAGAPTVVAPAPAKANLVGTVTTTPTSAAASAVVYLEDAPIEPTAKMSATVDNTKMTFTPFVAVIPVGGRIVFHNSDPFPHNVFSPDNEKFNIGNIAQNGGAFARVFKKPGSYTLLCNLHPGMLGYVVVAPSSYYAKADAKGHFTIKDVPAGTYKVTAWAPRQQTVGQPATLQGTDVTLDFELHR
jgi:plastocyanin